MNRDNIQHALEDEQIQALAAQCHAAMTELAGALSAQDFILFAGARAEEAEGDFSLDDVRARITERLTGFVLSHRELIEYRSAFKHWLEAGGDELGGVRASPINFQ